MKKINLNLIAILIATTVLSCASSENTPPKTAPTVTTSTISNITLNSASSGGNVTSDGGDAVTARGIVWNTATSPTISLTTKTTDGTGTGNFSSSITNLIPSSTYFVRAYTTNSVGTAYGNELSFTTGAIVLPTVSTTAITGITTNTAVSGGNIISDGGGTITARGVVWSTSQNPTIALTTKTTDGTGIGSYISNMTTLVQNTTYYVKAYATNSAGTIYGNQVEFKTNTSPVTGTVTDADGNVYKTVQIGSQLWMVENLKTTKYCNGDVIPNVTNPSQWQLITSGAYVYPGNNSSNNNTYGKLYNWYTVSDSRNPCPCGWRVPTIDEYRILGEYLGGIWKWDNNPVLNFKYYGIAEIVGTKMKSIGNIEDNNGLWYKSNNPGTNSSGFNGIPSGNDNYLYDSSDISIGKVTSWWSSSLVPSSNMPHYVALDYRENWLNMSPTQGYNGLSIRCIKN